MENSYLWNLRCGRTKNEHTTSKEMAHFLGKHPADLRTTSLFPSLRQKE